MNLPDFLNETEYGSIRIIGHRIGIEHVLYFYNEGYSAEMIWAQYPTLSLAVIHKVIAFYLEHKDEVDAYIAHGEAISEQLQATAKRGPSLTELRKRLEKMHKLEQK